MKGKKGDRTHRKHLQRLHGSPRADGLGRVVPLLLLLLTAAAVHGLVGADHAGLVDGFVLDGVFVAREEAEGGGEEGGVL